MANNKKKIDKKVRDESWKLKKFDIPQHSEDDVKQKRNQLKQLKNNAKNKQNPTPLDEIFIMKYLIQCRPKLWCPRKDICKKTSHCYPV